MNPLAELADRLSGQGFEVLRVDEQRLRVTTPAGPVSVRHDGLIFVVSASSPHTKVMRVCDDAEQVIEVVRGWQ